MSLDLGYVRRSLDAAVGLALRNDQSWKNFDLTADGFFRSFVAILFVIPLNIVFDLFTYRLAESQNVVNGTAYALANYGMAEIIFSTAVLCVGWCVFPLAMLALLTFLRMTERYSALIIAYNWSRIISELFNLPAIVLFALGFVSASGALNLLFISLGLTLYYRFYIAQTALGAGWGLAAQIAILDQLLALTYALFISSTAFLWLPAS